MQEKGFRVWLRTVRGLTEETVNYRISNCRRIEAYEGDLHGHWKADGLAGLIDRLTFSREDGRSGRPPQHRIPINGDVYNGTATLKHAAGLYREFRKSGERTSGSHTAPTRRRPHAPPVRPVRRPGAASGSPGHPGDPSRDFAAGSHRGRPVAPRHWPAWPQPSDKDLLELAATMAPFVRFLDPGVVRAVVEDNRGRGADWSTRLEALSIDPAIYLWEGSPCAFPGVRRYAGSTEIAVFRQRAAADEVPPQCLALDDNDYPKHLWAFVLTGRPFRKHGPDGYQLAHLLDHKEYGNRWRDELDFLPNAREPVLPYGLFTSATNSVYVPGAFLRPTDFSPKLRSLIQRRALQLYGDICRVVPPPLAIRPCEDRDWALDRFRWSAPVGGIDNVPGFLEFRRQRMEELFDNRLAALRTGGPPVTDGTDAPSRRHRNAPRWWRIWTT